MPVLALNLHAGFACRHSGACCTAGWPIPVEPTAAAAIRAGIPEAGAALTTAGRLPDGAAAIIAPTPGGACPFYLSDGGRLCDIQRRLGHEALPESCRHFPRIALAEADATRVTLSHFCPTAALMLFVEGPDHVVVVADAPGIADGRAYDGFDARRTIPPLLRPGVVMDGPSCRLWEAYLLDRLSRPDARDVEQRLAEAAAVADQIRAWRAGEESLASWTMAAVTAAPTGGAVRWSMGFASAARIVRAADDCVPPGLSRPALLDGGEAADTRLVGPHWGGFSRVVGRYLAARSFGAWSAYMGRGLRTQVAMLAVALAAVRVEASREALRSDRPLDDRLLHAAIRKADLLLNHLADAAALVRSQGGVEYARAAAWSDAIGLEARR
jgi:Fe-S-cluster containining protein